MRVWYSADKLRAMYAGGRPDAEARRANRRMRLLTSTGLLPRRVVTLEVSGRRSGKTISVPLAMTDVDGRWYLVAMLGECNWTRNVRAAGGRVTLVGRRPGILPGTRRYECTLTEVDGGARPEILARYVEVAPGGRPHVPVPPGAPLAEFAAVSAGFPVFEVDGVPPPRRRSGRR